MAADAQPCVEDMVIKPLLGVVAAAALLTACGGSGPAADSTHAARPTQASSTARPSTTASTTARAASTANPKGPQKSGPPDDCLQPPASCYTPQAFRAAYGITPLLARGIDGRGETVVLPEEAQPPGGRSSDIREDMAQFDRMFRLPAARLQVVNSLAGSATPWQASGEEIEDTEMVHAVAPGAAITIVLVKATVESSPAAIVAALTAFLRLGGTLGGVLSISASIGEHYLTRAEADSIDAALREDQDHDVTVVAATGDKGAASDMHFGTSTPVKEVSMPASDPLVLAAGGTSLTANPATGAYQSETAWNTLPAPPASDDGSSASGGGFSHLFARPSYQDGVPGAGATRGVPDVAGDAAFNTGLAVVDANGAYGNPFVGPATGTSAAAPFWAGLIALADQLAGRHLGSVNPAIYRIATGPDYHAAFHDITTGDNTYKFPPATITGYPAAPGWDPVTGWGTPDAAVLLPLLAQS
jgi:subtilase family serine protease